MCHSGSRPRAGVNTRETEPETQSTAERQWTRTDSAARGATRSKGQTNTDENLPSRTLRTRAPARYRRAIHSAFPSTQSPCGGGKNPKMHTAFRFCGSVADSGIL